jgi:hypothetical protein
MDAKGMQIYFSERVWKLLRIRIVVYVFFGGLAVLSSGCKSTDLADTNPGTGTSGASGSAPPPAPPPAPAVEPPPVPAPAPLPIPAPGPVPAAERPGMALKWNFWINSNATFYDPAPNLVMEDEYKARFALAPLDFTQIGGESGRAMDLSKELSEMMNAAKRSQRATLDLTVVVTPLHPEELELSSTPTPLFSISLKKLRSLEQSMADGKAADDSRHANENLALTGELINNVSIAQFEFKFRLHSAKPQKAAIAIIDRNSGLPLQTMTVDVTGKALIGDTSFAIAPEDLPPTDFSLILQDASGAGPANMIATLAILHRQDASYEIVTWNTNENIASLMNAIQGVVSAVNQLPFEQWRIKGWTLGRMIFYPKTISNNPSLSAFNQQSATRAREALMRAMDLPESEARKVMLVRVATVSDASQPDFTSPALPLSLIALGDTPAGSKFLGEHLITSLVLPGQSFTANAACDADWFVASPSGSFAGDDALSNAKTSALPFLDFARPYVHQQDPNLAELTAWLADDGAPRRHTVFTYLGHNTASGDLYMDLTTATIQPTQILREFDNGSIAIRDGCETVAPEINGGTAIGRLARQNVGSMIASIGAIEGDVAGKYLTCMSTELANGKAFAVGDLHYQTLKCVTKGTVATNRLGALKFLFVGNPYQQICKPRGTS